MENLTGNLFLYSSGKRNILFKELNFKKIIEEVTGCIDDNIPFVYKLTNKDFSQDAVVLGRLKLNTLFSYSYYLKSNSFTELDYSKLDKKVYKRGDFYDFISKQDMSKVYLGMDIYEGIDIEKINTRYMKEYYKSFNLEYRYDVIKDYLEEVFYSYVKVSALKLRSGRKGILSVKDTVSMQELTRSLFLNNIENRRAYKLEYLEIVYSELLSRVNYRVAINLISLQIKYSFVIESLLDLALEDPNDYNSLAKGYTKIVDKKENKYNEDNKDFNYVKRVEIFNRAIRTDNSVSIFGEIEDNNLKTISSLEDKLLHEKRLFDLDINDGIYYIDGSYSSENGVCSGAYVTYNEDINKVDGLSHKTLDSEFIKLKSLGSEYLALFLALKDIKDKGIKKVLFVTDNFKLFNLLVRKEDAFDVLEVDFKDEKIIRFFMDMLNSIDVVPSKTKAHKNYNKINSLCDALAKW